MLGLGLSLGLAPIQGVPVIRFFDGVRAILLLDADGAPARDVDGAYLYEVF